MQLGHYQLFMCSSPSYGGSRAKCDHHTVLAADTPDVKKSWVNPSTKQVLELSSSEGSKGELWHEQISLSVMLIEITYSGMELNVEPLCNCKNTPVTCPESY